MKRFVAGVVLVMATVTATATVGAAPARPVPPAVCRVWAAGTTGPLANRPAGAVLRRVATALAARYGTTPAAACGATEPLRVLTCDSQGDATEVWYRFVQYNGALVGTDTDTLDLVVTGGTPPYAFSAVGLDGYVLNADGSLTLTSATPGTTDAFTLVVTDAAGAHVELPGQVVYEIVTTPPLPATC